ncbi:MAG: HAMP domain-containing histidine kinase [Lachnospiraceae bacterium]|nr:HAMP domain-containing histidine kinase [Lachnospiraceae bacterium]
MKRSIRIRYTVIITAVVAAVFAAVMLFMAFGLEPFVSGSKEKEIRSTIARIEELSADGFDKDDAFELVRLSMEKNFGISIYTLSSEGTTQIFSTNVSIETVRSRFDFYLRFGTVNADRIIENTDSYVLYRTFDARLNAQQIECMGKTENVAYIISTSMAGIIENASITNRFLLYVSLAGVLIAAVVVYLVCRSLTRPISELAEQSENISNLNFSSRFTGDSKDEIGTLGRNMNQMSDRLEDTIIELQNANSRLQSDIAEKERINKMQKDFLANVSHELKTPIALIQGYAEGLKEGVSEDTAFYTDVIVEEADHMNTIVRRLLNLDEIESGRLEPVMEEFDLVEVVRGVISSSSLLSKDKDVHIRISAPETLIIRADEFMIEQAVQNYLSNACHHVSDPGTICVSAGTYADGKVYLEVFNTGKPIPEEDLPRIWEKFFKVDKAHTRSYGGSGIGLSIVRTVIELHGGSVSARNTEDGVIFGFVLDKGTDQSSS